MPFGSFAPFLCEINGAEFELYSNCVCAVFVLHLCCICAVFVLYLCCTLHAHEAGLLYRCGASWSCTWQLYRAVKCCICAVLVLQCAVFVLCALYQRCVRCTSSALRCICCNLLYSAVPRCCCIAVPPPLCTAYGRHSLNSLEKLYKFNTAMTALAFQYCHMHVVSMAWVNCQCMVQ